ncbi:MAG: 2'-deoxycytidine 5'-triphosphate deaminase [Planctomycetota bacterium]
MPPQEASVGILVDRQIEALIESGAIRGRTPLGPDQIQPASLDLRLGARGFRIRSGFLPEGVSVEDKLEKLKLYPIDLEAGAVLEIGQAYLFPLQESLALPEHLSARSNPKSSTGRLDLFTRIITDRCSRFDDIPAGYRGPIYLEVVPRSFPVRVRPGHTLNQIRFFDGPCELDDEALRQEHEEAPLLFDADGQPIPASKTLFDDGLVMRVGLHAQSQDGIVGYRARRYTPIVDLSEIGVLDIEEFWEPMRASGSSLILEPEEFYIFASRDRVRVPAHLAAEMVAYDVGIGELRTNYAGFFDNGFGDGRGQLRGTAAVLEVRPHDVPFLIEDNQVFFKLKFYRTAEKPDRLYGDSNLGSSYQGQGLRLSKHFRQ